LDLIQTFLECKEHESRLRDPFVTYAVPGHFYSPLPEFGTLGAHYAQIDRSNHAVPGIDLREQAQIDLAHQFSKYYPQLPWGDGQRKGETRFYFNDGVWYTYGDAITLYSVINHFAPRRFIEIGSGYSSAVTLDTCELFLGGRTSITLIEPYPHVLLKVLVPRDDQRKLLVRSEVQKVDPALFAELQENDILFVDSSHVVKFGSDVQFIFTQVLPRLRPGVLIHFHDIFWPFEYPLEWLKEGRAWNEAYFLRTLLTDNPRYEIVYFIDYMGTCHRDVLQATLPLCVKRGGCGLWIRKVK